MIFIKMTGSLGETMPALGHTDSASHTLQSQVFMGPDVLPKGFLAATPATLLVACGGGKSSTNQMGAELARWFGVSATDMPAVLPNAKNFDLYKLGLFKA